MPPTFIHGNMWDDEDCADLFLVTTNATLNKQGHLVMGRGAALEMTKRFPLFARTAGACLKSSNLVGGVYGVRTIYPVARTTYGIFQVKYHWADDADIRLIAYSCAHLLALTATTTYTRIVLNFPGIGHGRLSRATVLPWLLPLPSHVYIYEKG